MLQSNRLACVTRFELYEDYSLLTSMVFAERLREGVCNGSITCSVRIWKRLHVKVRGRYQMGEGEIEVDSIEQIALKDITHELAIESGFLSVIDLLKVAKHGPGDEVFLISFHYIPPHRTRKARARVDR